MDGITHLFVGLLLGASLAAGEPALVALVTAFAVLPDIDTITWAFPKAFPGLRHRGVTHAIVVGEAAAAMAAAAFAMSGLASFPVAFLFASIGFLSHVMLDILNWGCLALWPWVRTPIEYTVQPGLTGTAVTSTAGLVVLGGTYALAPGRLAAVVAVFGSLFIAYLALRVVLKVVAHGVHGRDPWILPTANPFVWLVYPRVRDAETGRWNAWAKGFMARTPGERWHAHRWRPRVRGK